MVIVGRPNVGKSSLLNTLTGERISIVDPRAGITRDRVSAVTEIDDRYFELIDTGGIGMVDDDQLDAHVHEQIDFAIRRARLVLFVVDVQQGLVPLDDEVAQRLRRIETPVIPVANKADVPAHEPQAAEFERLGFGEPLCVSAAHGFGCDALLERIAEHLPDTSTEPAIPVMKVAIVGKRNAGKSTLVNALARDNRMIVSEVPGTTRDAVDVTFEKDGRQFIAIDTAGVRRKKSMNDIDFYSYTRAVRSIERADVVLHLIDSTVAISEVDLKLAGAVLERERPLALVINKWDLAKDRAASQDYGDYLSQVMPMVSYAPIVFVTAKDNRNVDTAIDVALGLHRQAHTRVPTSQLNNALQSILELRGPSAKRGTKQVKIYYATQVATGPPTIVFSCNTPTAVTTNYRRFMENRLREILPFAEVPMRLLFRSHRRSDGNGR